MRSAAEVADSAGRGSLGQPGPAPAGGDADEVRGRVSAVAASVERDGHAVEAAVAQTAALEAGCARRAPGGVEKREGHAVRIARVAAERDLPITTAFADLRLGLPPAYAGRADLAFTDPPYTPEGVGLFVTRALVGLRRSGQERVAIAYGFSPHQLTRGFRTQSALHELRLVLEAVLPRFNRFDGAEAIGAAAALYVARPTRWTWPIVDRAGGVDPRIYTRGAASAESGASPLPAATVALLDAAVPGPDRLLVGDGWPDTAEGR